MSRWTARQRLKGITVGERDCRILFLAMLLDGRTPLRN
jgi:hypothetical protein